MFPSWLPDEVSAANTALRSMRNKGARWWCFSVSHTTFDIVIGEPLGDDNVVLCIPACGYLAGPVEWPNQQIEIELADNVVLIQDHSVGFRAEGRSFRWRRNYDILSFHGIWGARGSGPKPEIGMDEVSRRFSDLLSEYYKGDKGYDELAGDVNSLLWYTLPTKMSAKHSRDPRLD